MCYAYLIAMCSFPAIASLSPTKYWAINAYWCQPLNLRRRCRAVWTHFGFRCIFLSPSHVPVATTSFCPLCLCLLYAPRAVTNLCLCIATNCFRLVKKRELSNAKIVCSDSQVHKLHNRAAWSKIPYAMCICGGWYFRCWLSSYCYSSIESQR